MTEIKIFNLIKSRKININIQPFYFLIFVIFAISICVSSAGAQDKDGIDNQLIFKEYYKEAIKAISQKKFTDADSYFKKIARLEMNFPDELAYFYGYTQFNLGKYVQAKEAFEKYISLRTDTGRYAHYAKQYIHTADCNLKGFFFETTTCDECKGGGKSEIECRTCKGKGKEVCNKCFGRGALRKNDNFGEIFETCKKCEGTGYYTCLKCHGAGKELDKCFICEGKGTLRLKKDCHLQPQIR